MSTRMRRALVGLVAVMVTALATAFLSAAPSQAEPKKLKVSESATGPWSDNLSTPLFWDLGPFVPQDAVTDTFYVKNNSSQPARATLAVIDRGASNAFEDDLSFDYNVGGTTSDVPVVIDSKNKCKTFVTGPSIDPGAVQPVGVVLHFADVTEQTAMNETASVDFVLTLSQVGPKGKVDICGTQALAQPFTECKSTNSTNSTVVTLVGKTSCPVVAGVEAFADPQTGPGALDSTGAPRSLSTLLPLALGLLLAGAGLLAFRRRAQSSEE